MNKIQKNELEQLINQNLFIRDIAKKLGYTTQTVSRYIKHYNILRKKYPVKDLKNKQFGRLTVIEYDGQDRHHKAKWKCICKCGKIRSVNAASLLRNLTTSCGCRNTEVKRHNGYKDISAQFFRRIKSEAKQRNINFELTMADIWYQYEKQNYKCFYSGLNLKFDTNCCNRPADQTGSIDRIDSSIGYTKNNIVICHKVINRMKYFLTIKEFIAFCNLIAITHKEDYENCLDHTNRTLLRKI